MKTLAVLFFCCLLFSECKKDVQASYQHTGTIIGYDPRMCPSPACGGLLIAVKNDTAKSAATVYRTRSILSQLGITEDVKPPVNVNLDFKPDTGIFANYNYIIVTRIEVIR